MALKATIHKAIVNVADMDNQRFLDQSFTLARHPSETEMRLMLRLVAWILNADEALVFSKGLTADDEPELWRVHDNGDIELWIELGLPDERRLKKAAGRAKQVILFAYSERAAQVWRQQHQHQLASLKHLQILFIDDATLEQLAGLCKRSIRLQATIQDGELWLSSDTQQVTIKPKVWQ